MSEPSSLPPPLGCRDPKSWGYFTLTQRFPKIIAQARAGAGDPDAKDRRWDALLRDVLEGNPMRPELLPAPSEYWSDYLGPILERPWSVLPFFDTELCFYLAINTLAGFYSSGLDVFAPTKNDARRKALPQVGSASESISGEGRISSLVERALAGNEADLSRFESGVGSLGDDGYIVDDRPGLLEALVAASRGDEVHVVLDNAGLELCWDLLLGDALLESGLDALVLQAKPCPMFVSDATVADVDETIQAFFDDPKLRSIGERLDAARTGGRLRVEGAPSFGEPRHFDDLEPELTRSLSRAAVVLAKGDLNYRRFVQDRAWPADTAASLALSSSFSAVALRVLKSEAVVGVESSRVRSLFERDPEWRTNGRHAMVQVFSTAGLPDDSPL
jgi:hypothetical protein